MVEAVDLVVFLSADGVVRLCNRASEELVGHPPSELIGRDLAAFVAESDHRMLADSARAALRHRDDPQPTPAPVTLELVHRTGRVVPVSIELHALPGSEPAALCCLVRDARAEVQRRSELRRRADELEAQDAINRLIQSSPDVDTLLEQVTRALMAFEDLELEPKAGVFLVDDVPEQVDGRTRLPIAGTPDRALRLHRTIGEFSSEFLTKESWVPLGACLCGRAAVSGEVIVSMNCFTDHRHEHTFEGMTPHGHYIVPLKTAEEVIGVIFLYTAPDPIFDERRVSLLETIGVQVGEATERLRAHERLRQAEARLRELADRLETARLDAVSASAAKSRFLAHMSHEIRTPLNGIIGMTDALLDMPLSDEQRETVDIIRTSGDLLTGLVHDILDLSKIEAGHLVLEDQPFRLAEVVFEVQRMLGRQAAERGNTLHSDLQEDGLPVVVGDRRRFTQIVLNLLTNAIKFTERGDVEISVRTEVAESAGRVLVEVRDTGIGMSPQQCARIFDAFVQAEDSTARRFGGTGLGLAISRELTEAMGGEMSVRSAVGEGTTFTFWIRVGIPAVEDQRALRPSQMSAGFRGRVLVVDDDEINRRVAARLLRKMGFDVETVGSGADALERSARASFDLILMDYQMPGMDGCETTRALRRRESARPVPVVAMTASVLESDRRRCLEAGMDAFVSKPVRRESLTELLASLGMRPESPEARAQGEKPCT